MQAKRHYLLNRTYIYFLVSVLLVLLLSKCKFDKEESDKKSEVPPISQPPPIKTISISKEGVYFISQYWETKKMDSLVNTDPAYYTLQKNEVNYLFITQSKDSIVFSIRKTTIENPVIIFNGIDGPILSSYKNLRKYYSIQEPELSNIPITPKLHNEDSITTQNQNKHPFEHLEFISSNNITYLEYTSNRKLKSILSIETSMPYPCIPDKKSLEIQFDNDFWNYTDIYYTNGIRLGYIHPVFSNSPLSYLLVSNARNGLDYYGIQIVQHMYTGIKPKVDSIIPGDRPWASYSVIGQFARSFDWENKIRHESEINFGLLGPKSGGGFLQNLVHTILPNNSPAQGWDNQIKTDIIIDYQYRILKSIYESRHFESYIKGSAQAGSLRDNLKWGFGAKWGKFTPFYMDDQHQIYQESKRKINYSIFGDIETQLIGYDATLQGGVTDRTSIYVIPTRDMSRFVIQGFLGAEISYKKLNLQFIQYWKSKEFKTGSDHKYVSVRLNIGF